MNTPCEDLVSVIIPCYNAESFVVESIESVLAQTYSSIEIIVVDDGSTDNSVAMLNRFLDRQCVRVVCQLNRGPGAARNLGLSLAKGEFVQFLDADDILTEDKIAASVEAFTPEIGAVVAEKEFFMGSRARGNSQLVIERTRNRPIDSSVHAPEQTILFTLQNRIGTPGPLHRASCIRAVGGFREDLRNLEDIELHFRLAVAGVKFKSIPRVLVRCRHHHSPGRLRLSDDRNLVAIQAIQIMREHASSNGALVPRVRRSLADRLANHGRKAYAQGYRTEGLKAIEEARELHRFPRPTASPFYNLAYFTLGIKYTEALRVRAEDALSGLRGVRSNANGGANNEPVGGKPERNVQ